MTFLGVASAGVCILFIIAFIWFKPDRLSLSDRYFPSPTSTLTSTLTLTATPTATTTNTLTPTPNLTATQYAIQVTTTAQAIQTTLAIVGNQWDILLSDGFETNKNQWVVGKVDYEYATTIQTVENDVYKWDATAKKSFIDWVPAVTKPVSDFSLTVEAQRTGGSRFSDYGLIFRKDYKDNFYYFGIDNKDFFVSINYDGEWIDIIDWTSSSVILPASPNRLTVIATGSQFIFLINDQFVATATDDRIPQGTTAMAIELYRAGLKGTFEFDNFELREP